ncbi:MAG TPA: sigma-70 family RNA polymerase sigma factor [Verrucomicrobiae bacterium]|nr:sigma-70 family RNA polymerase sigma factor [Verrucomicrobiae bacterium]
MATSDRQSTTEPLEQSHFQTTHWSVVLAAGQGDSPRRAEALEKLCRAYWYPLYAYVRQRGHGPEDAQDLTQEFLARLLEKNWLADLDPHTGRFRSFLLTALNRFLINEYDRGQAAKRGGGRKVLSLDQAQAEGRYLHEPATDETPEKIFDRRWALAVLDQALAHLRAETSAVGKSQPFELLNPFLSREAEAGEYAAIAQQLGLSVGAVGVAVHRLRQRYREVARQEVAQTLADAAQVDEEMRHLFAALRRQISV